jgi:hypothetical protein
MMATELSFNNGKTLPVFSAKQLESMNPQILRMRGLDLKEALAAMGHNAQMPRHPETLTQWIVDTQDALLNGGHGAVMEQARPVQGMGAQHHQEPHGRGADTMSESQQDSNRAYSDAQMGARAARDRNSGSSNLLSWN